MGKPKMSRRGILTSGLGCAAASVAPRAVAGQAAARSPERLAPRPPMGWNSWNSFATTITGVLAVNQASHDNRPHFVEDGARIWSARPIGREGNYVALFNTTDRPKRVGITLRDLGRGEAAMVRDLWAGRNLGTARGRVEALVAPHGAELYRLA